MASSLGTLFRISTFGESHGVGVGVVVDGCPPRVSLCAADIQVELDRRRPGQSRIVTQRKEGDEVEILSGVSEDGLTLGTPIALLVRNSDARLSDYDELKDKYRPSHADFAYDQKFGIRAWSGGGRASARETIGRVAAGAIAQKVLREQFGVEIVAFVESVQGITAAVDLWAVTRERVDANIVRCPDAAMSEKMIAHIEMIRKEGNTVGGVIGCVARGVPAGWGEPVFDKLEADLAKALMSLPASKGFEIGSGFGGTLLTGTEHNDEFRATGYGSRGTGVGVEGFASADLTPSPSPPPSSRLGRDEGAREGNPKPIPHTTTNYSGGIQGGISNGMPITMRVAFKPVATVMQEQDTVTTEFENTTIKGRGRHDPCVLPRAVPMVEAMVSLVLLDHALRQRALTLG